ncbi:MAG: transketolase [Planctomycetes bacterium]|nr:transketolase [Planctomycetota bacterium]
MPGESDHSVALANRIRMHSLRMIHTAQASHIGTCLSIADLLAVLYHDFLRVSPATLNAEDRDRFILSKGHGAAALYAVLAERGFFPIAELDSYNRDGSRLTGHASHHVPGVELSTGSLGHGLSVGAGLALAAKRLNLPYRTVVLLSDGELDEGSNWEAALFAGHHQLDRLVAIVDYNKIQSYGSVREVLDLEPLTDKWRAFRWYVTEIDGHQHDQIRSALNRIPSDSSQPSVLIAHTVKGKGVSYMEHQLAWHYKSPSQEQLRSALAELEAQP